MKKISVFALGVVFITGITSAFVLKHLEIPTEELAQEITTPPLGLPPIPWPDDNPYSQEKAYLGKLLYFDKRLSADGTISCASCHTIQDGFADAHVTSTGIEGRQGTRNSPTIINTAYLKYLFWDGRASSLEEQAKGPIANSKEMALATNPHDAYRESQTRIANIPGYQALFQQVFDADTCSIDHIAQAIATFERTILSGNSPYDRYMAGDKHAMTKEQIRGLFVFKRAACIACHNGPNFNDERFFNIGIGMDQEDPDLGRYLITSQKNDWGAFKVPSLREVKHTYPYMHNGEFGTLDQVIEYYDKGGNPNPNLHHLMKPLHLSQSDKKALVSFLEALSGEGWQHIKEPVALP